MAVAGLLTACSVDSERSLVLGVSHTLAPELGSQASSLGTTFAVDEITPCPMADVILTTSGRERYAVVTLEFDRGEPVEQYREVTTPGAVRIAGKCPEGAELRRIRVASVLINPNGH